MEVIDLQLTDAYHRAKRNVLFASSVATIFWLAAPLTISIPTFEGPELTNRIGSLCLLGALVFLAVSWWLQLQFGLTKNSIAGQRFDHEGAISDHVDMLEGQLRSETDSAISLINALKAAMPPSAGDLFAQWETEITSMFRPIFANATSSLVDHRTKSGGRFIDPDTPERAIKRLENALQVGIDGLKDRQLDVTRIIGQNFSTAQQQIERLSSHHKGMTENLAKLIKEFTRLSRDISVYQRINFKVLDQYFVSAFAVASALMSLDGIFAYRARAWGISLIA